jgi:hypothetical protein
MSTYSMQLNKQKISYISSQTSIKSSNKHDIFTVSLCHFLKIDRIRRDKYRICIYNSHLRLTDRYFQTLLAIQIMALCVKSMPKSDC